MQSHSPSALRADQPVARCGEGRSRASEGEGEHVWPKVFSQRCSSMQCITKIVLQESCRNTQFMEKRQQIIAAEEPQ